MMEHMKIVKKATGVNKATKKPEPPKEYLDFWAKVNLYMITLSGSYPWLGTKKQKNTSDYLTFDD